MAMVILRVVSVQAADLPEYQVKAAMLYNVSRFVEWPENKTDRPIQLCVIGKSPFGAALDSLQDKLVHGRQLKVRRISSIDEIGSCQILFISSSERRNLAAILGNGELAGVLTVSDIDRFAATGGTIGLFEVDGKMKIEVNLEAARQSQLKIGAQLLKLTRIVRGAEK
jgi:hypothetical protein